MDGDEIRKGSRVRLKDGREGTVTDFEGRRLTPQGAIGAGAVVELDDGSEVTVGPTSINLVVPPVEPADAAGGDDQV